VSAKPGNVNVFVRIGAPYSDDLHAAMCADLLDFALDGDRFRFVVVWCEAPKLLGIEVRVRQPYDGDAGLCERLVGHGLAIVFIDV
jgi:hypothetical protein